MHKPIDSVSPNQRARSGLCHSLPSIEVPIMDDTLSLEWTEKVLKIHKGPSGPSQALGMNMMATRERNIHPR